MENNTMPQYMFKSPRGTGYLFRRAIPEDVRQTIGKREFKVTLGGDYRNATQRCRELAVETDQQIAAARAASSLPPPANDVVERVIAQRPEPLAVIHTITPDLVAQLHSAVAEQVQSADRVHRYRAREAINPAEKLREIEKVRNWAVMARYGDDTAVYGWLEMLTGTLQRNGYRLADELRDSAQERELLIEYASAYRDALDALEAEYSGKPSPVKTFIAPPLKRAEQEIAPIAKAMLLSAAIAEFLEHLRPNKMAMNEKHGFILPAFLEVVGDMPITELRQAHIKDFLLTVQKLPPRWSDLRRKERGAIRELAARDWDETLSLSTYDGTYRASLSTFLNRAVADWQDAGFPTTLTTNIPYLGTRIKAEKKQRAVRPHEIRMIFFHEKMEKILNNPTNVHKFWLLALELYTGARVREICQVNPQHDWGYENGIWWMRFTEEVGELPAPDVIKSIKTRISRTIPMHAELVRLGFPEYLQRLKHAGARRLFPQWAATNGDAGATPTKWVGNYLRAIGLHGIMNEKGNALRGSHAFRHTLLTYGRKNRVNLRCISGHKEEENPKNLVADGYEDETLLLPLSEKADRLAKLDYGIELPMPVPALIPATPRQSRTSPRVKTRQ